jgi:NAD(P)-dependent dehydrogenase (short-subunit alcohol dehydrogenase family)
MQRASKVLVTGASRGLGLEFVRQYAQAGWRVHATCRSPERAQDLNRLAEASHGSVTVHVLDVTEAKHIKAIREMLQGQPLDMLINNAGVLGPKLQEFGHTDVDAWVYTLRVNAIAPLKLIEALVDNLVIGERRLVVNLTSRMGSIADNSSGGYYIYRASKAALNAVVRNAALDLAPRKVTVVALHPGWVRTDMGGPDAKLDPVRSVEYMRTALDRMKLADSGGFFDLDGTPIPW